MKSALQSPRQLAIGDVWTLACPDDLHAKVAVDAVFYRLREPDREMLEAGARELATAMPPGMGQAYARDLAGVVFRAMLEAAR